jgi:predicted dehydrogenase
MSQLRIALIGAGLIGRAHAARILASPACQLAAIVDPQDSARALANDYGVAWFGDIASLLEHSRGAAKPDGAIIATPNALHVSHGLACLQAGIPALVEKPLADTVEGAYRLAEASEQLGVPLLVGHHRRHNPIAQAARAAVRGGRLGRITAVQGSFLLLKPDDYFDVAWRREAGGGPVLINLIHDIDLLRFICGDIVAVQAMTSSVVRGFAVEDTAAALLRFDCGALGTLLASDTTPAPWSWELTAGENSFYPRQEGQNCYLVTGTEGALALPSLQYWRYAGARGWGEPLASETLAHNRLDPLVAQLDHFCQVIRGTAEPLITGRDGARSLAVATAVHAAALGGRQVVPA